MNDGLTGEMLAQIKRTLGPAAFARWARAELAEAERATLAKDPATRVIVLGETDSRPDAPRFWFIGRPAIRDEPVRPPVPALEREVPDTPNPPGPPRLGLIEGGAHPPAGGWTNAERDAAKREQFPDAVDLHPRRGSLLDRKF